MDNDFISEIDEEIKEERLLKLWQKYGHYLIAAIVAVVIGTACFVGWNSYQRSIKETEAADFFDAMRMLTTKDYAGAIAKMETVADKSKHYRALAQFRQAVLIIEKANVNKQADAANIIPKEAVDIYKSMIDDKKIDSKFRDLAAIAYVLVVMDHGDPKELIKLLQGQVVAVNPWSNFAKELIGFLSLKIGDKDTAKKMVEELSKDKNLSQSAMIRLHILKTAISG